MLKFEIWSLKWRILRRLKLADNYEFMLFRAKQDFKEIVDEAKKLKDRIEIIDDKIQEVSKELISSMFCIRRWCEDAIKFEAEDKKASAANLAVLIKNETDQSAQKYNKLWDERENLYPKWKDKFSNGVSYEKRVGALEFLVMHKHSYDKDNYRELMALTDNIKDKTPQERNITADRLVNFLRKNASDIPPFLMEYVEAFDKEARSETKRT